MSKRIVLILIIFLAQQGEMIKIYEYISQQQSQYFFSIFHYSQKAGDFPKKFADIPYLTVHCQQDYLFLEYFEYVNQLTHNCIELLCLKPFTRALFFDFLMKLLVCWSLFPAILKIARLYVYNYLSLASMMLFLDLLIVGIILDELIVVHLILPLSQESHGFISIMLEVDLDSKPMGIKACRTFLARK